MLDPAGYRLYGLCLLSEEGLFNAPWLPLKSSELILSTLTFSAVASNVFVNVLRVYGLTTSGGYYEFCKFLGLSCCSWLARFAGKTEAPL